MCIVCAYVKGRPCGWLLPTYFRGVSTTIRGDKLTWAAIKARELGKTVYAVASVEPHSGGFRLKLRAPRRGAYLSVAPAGTITTHAA